MSLARLQLSVRVNTALNNAGISTEEALCALTVVTLAEVKGLGKKGQNEVKDAMRNHGLSLLPTGTLQDWEELPAGVISVLKKAGITTERKLCSLTAEGLAKVSGLGKKRQRQIKGALENRGKSLASEESKTVFLMSFGITTAMIEMVSIDVRKFLGKNPSRIQILEEFLRYYRWYSESAAIFMGVYRLSGQRQIESLSKLGDVRPDLSDPAALVAMAQVGMVNKISTRTDQTLNALETLKGAVLMFEEDLAAMRSVFVEGRTLEAFERHLASLQN